MQISFSPVRLDATLTVIKTDDVLTINGEDFDFSDLPDGATLPQSAVLCDWLVSDVQRTAGVIHLTLALPLGADAPHEMRFPAPIKATDGAIALPAHNNSEAGV